jgi:diguanylate cyclase (GGDEF)-like protein
LRDITERKRASQELARQATHDALTDLPNRRRMHELLTAAVADLAEHKSRLGVLFIDLDGFKSVNDLLGHEAGDDVLREAAKRVAANIRPGDVAGRLGGDEFIVLLTDLPSFQDAELVAGRLVRALSQPISIGDETIRVGASIGIATTEDATVSVRQFIASADEAMYIAKQSGKGCWHRAEPLVIDDLDRELES